jgi:tetratricopeptide (TPR) repeat protein
MSATAAVPMTMAIPAEKPVAFHPCRLRPLHRRPRVADWHRKADFFCLPFFTFKAKSCWLRRIIYAPFIIVAFLFVACDKDKKETAQEYTELQWGLHYYYANKFDSAILMFSRAASSSTDSLDKANANIFLAMLLRQAGDLYAAQQSLTAALRVLDPDEPQHQASLVSTYNELGNISIDLKNYQEAVNFYNTGEGIAKDPGHTLEILNGKATALQKMGRYREAIIIYDSILENGPSKMATLARVISNRAKTRWLMNPELPVLDEYWQALKIRLDSQYHDGLNASYAHLSDYYANVKPDSALWFAEKMYENAKQYTSPDDVLEATDKLIRLSRTSATKQDWYDQFKRINDSLSLARDTTRSRYALIRYDAQKSKADNLLLQQRITRQRAWMFSLVSLAILIIATITVAYQRRRKRIRQETENAIREAQLKTSKKVHDVVANGLYHIMNELEHKEAIEKEPLITKIEGLYEQSRNISYEERLETSADFPQKIHELLAAYSNAQTKVIVIGNQASYWNVVNAMQKRELQLVLQELLVNMRKHSEAKNVVIRFQQEKGRILVHYKDDGIGFPSPMEFGNGLQNTVNRIETLRGEIIFGESGQAGVSITISLPTDTNQP